MIKKICVFVVILLITVWVTSSVLFKYGDNLISNAFVQYNKSQNTRNKSGISTFTVVSKNLWNCVPISNVACIGNIHSSDGPVYKIVGLDSIKMATFFAHFKIGKTYTCYWEWGHYGWEVIYCYNNV